MQKAMKKNGITNKKGYTIIIAVIIMAVLLIIGVAVLTSAANSLNAVNQRTLGRQAYYAAKSAINVMDVSIHGGELGSYIRDKAVQQFPDTAAGGTAQINEQMLEANSVTLEDNSALDKMKISDLKIRYSGSMQYLTESGTDRKVLSLTVNLSFTAESNGETYKLNAAYAYEGKARLLTGNGIMWETQTWETKSIDQ